MKRSTLAAVAATLLAGALIACSSSSSSPSGAATGAALGAACQVDTDCASSSRGTVACFSGGGGDGGGEGGTDGGASSASKTWCSLKCTPDNQAQLCGAPFDGTCNTRGYCRLN